MANVSFNRGDNTKMDNTPITDGLIFINTEESEIFFDNNDTRISIGGSGGGHVIQNPAGTSVAQEPNMQFKDARITDDSTNEKTVVEVVDEKTLAQFNALPLTGSADGIYVIGDGQGGSGIDASEINYDNTTSGMTATDVQDAIDELNSDFAGSTSSADGTHGLVPAPLAGDEDKCLKGDGTWGSASCFPNVSADTVVQSSFTSGQSYTFNEDVAIIGRIYNGTDTAHHSGAKVYINGILVTMAEARSLSYGANFPIYFPIKKGDSFTIESYYGGGYNITAYSMH